MALPAAAPLSSQPRGGTNLSIDRLPILLCRHEAGWHRMVQSNVKKKDLRDKQDLLERGQM